MEEFSKKKHKVFLLGLELKGDIHQTVERFGVKTDVYLVNRDPSFLYYIKHMLYLRKYIKRHKIDLVYSHTQPVNFIAVFTQYLVNTNFYICRHHSDYIMNGNNRNAKFFDKVINRLGKRFIVPSKKVYDQITKVEGVKTERVSLINYAYHFENYGIPDLNSVDAIREKYPAKLLVTTVSRFIPCKRYNLLIDCVTELISKGNDIKLLILGNGPLEQELKKQVSNLKMEGNITFIGFTTNAMDYMAASDMVVHISDSEASNSVIKEAGILKKIVAVCNDVGDFDDYIENGKSGFVLSKKDPCPELQVAVKKVYADKAAFAFMGENLRNSVLQNFSVENVMHAYKEVMN